MTWYLYINQTPFELLRVSDSQFTLGPGEAQIENPTVTATSGQRVFDVDTIRAATQPEIDTFQAARDAISVLKARNNAKSTVDISDSDDGQLIRGLALVMLDEVNTLRQQHALPDRTKSQLLTAVKNKINAGDAD